MKSKLLVCTAAIALCLTLGAKVTMGDGRTATLTYDQKEVETLVLEGLVSEGYTVQSGSISLSYDQPPSGYYATDPGNGVTADVVVTAM
jgi:hypothetical protein